MTMPVLFLGHGSPMNAIEDNPFTRGWEEIAGSIPRPKAILSVSAHWYGVGTKTSDTLEPKQIYDMGGFPEELYHLSYPCPGSKELAGRVMELLGSTVSIDNRWGIDHGTWSVLVKMYPEGDIPVVQLSIDANKSPMEHLALGRLLAPLREEGILILGSGNVVHNLRLVDWTMDHGAPWADAFDGRIRDLILAGNHEGVAGEAQGPAVPTPDHYLPLLYVLGATKVGEKVRVYNEARILGSLSMTSYLIG